MLERHRRLNGARSRPKEASDRQNGQLQRRVAFVIVVRRGSLLGEAPSNAFGAAD
jgi:hypothetical protein